MDAFTSSTYRELAKAHDGLRVSIYMPTHPAGIDEFQDAVRLKTLLDQAERQLGQTGMTPQDTGKFLGAARELIEQKSFWHDREKGLALFIDQKGFQAFRLPITFPELAAVSDRWITRYLLPLITDDRAFWLITLTRNQVKFYRGSRFTLEEKPISKMPANMEQALSIDSADRGQQVHHGGIAGPRKQNAVFHGQGGESDADQRQFREYIRAIWHAIKPTLANSQDPLVVGGVAYEAAEFKSVSDYRHIVEEVIAGNPTLLNKHDLHERAWKVVAPSFADLEAESFGKYRQQVGTGTTSEKIEEILLAAHSGDLDTLIVDPQVQCWGHFDPASERIIMHDAYQPMDHDLVDQAVTLTYQSKGHVRIQINGKPQLPNGLAAIYRKGRIPRAPRLVGDDQSKRQFQKL